MRDLIARSVPIIGRPAIWTRRPKDVRAGNGSGVRKRKWRNWQTHQLEGLAAARSWGFESPLPHHIAKMPGFPDQRINELRLNSSQAKLVNPLVRVRPAVCEFVRIESSLACA